MLRTFKTTIGSIDREIILTSINIEKTIILSQNRKTMKYFEYINFVLTLMSDLSNDELGKITIADAVSLIVYYRFIDWSEFEATGEPKLYAENFIDSTGDFKDGEAYEEIGGYKFSPFIKLSDSLKAEVEWFKIEEANPKIKARLLPIHLLATAYIDGYEKGIEILNNIPYAPNIIGTFEKIDNIIMQTSPVNLSLFHKSGKISIVSEEVGGERYALPFQRSFFLTFDL